MIRMLISVPIIAVILLFAFVNNQLVTFNVWTDMEVTSSFSVVVIALVFLGFILGRISAWFAYFPLRRNLISQKSENKRLNKEHQKISKENASLKGSLEDLKIKETATKSSGEKSEEDTNTKGAFVKFFKSPEK